MMWSRAAWLAAPASLAVMSQRRPKLVQCAPKKGPASRANLAIPQSWSVSPPEAIVKRPAASDPRPSTTGMQLPLADYKEVVDHWKSKGDAYDSLGINVAIQGCKAKVLKNKGKDIFLICHRYNLGCPWKGVLTCKKEGHWELRKPPGLSHNEELTNTKGKSGFATLAQREEAKKRLLAAVVVQPRMALNALRADDEVDDSGINLAKIQQLKKQLSGADAKQKQSVGDLAKASLPHERVPTSDVAGYLILRKVSVDAATNKPYVTFVATTKKSLRKVGRRRRGIALRRRRWVQKLLAWMATDTTRRDQCSWKPRGCRTRPDKRHVAATCSGSV